MGPRELEIIADSLRSVFPVVGCWWGRLENDQSMIALIGSEEPLDVDVDSLAARLAPWTSNAMEPDAFIASVTNLSHLYVGDWQIVNAGKLNLDEKPRIEFLTPISYTRRELLRGERLVRYFDEMLFRLPQDSVVWHVGDQPVIHDQQRLEWQRKQLLRHVERGKGRVEPPEFLKPSDVRTESAFVE